MSDSLHASGDFLRSFSRSRSIQGISGIPSSYGGGFPRLHFFTESLTAFAGYFPFTQAEGQNPIRNPGAWHVASSEVVMLNKSLAKYVRELRKELLENSPVTAPNGPNDRGLQAKPSKKRGNKVNGSASGGQKH